MSFGAGSARERAGRPTQFHGVPYEERALDSAGGRLPWALEFPEGHNAVRNLRKPVEEKGSFGRSMKRTKGSVRGTTRTQTPAKKEGYPSLDGFEAALKYESVSQKPTEQQQQSSQPTHTAFANETLPAIPVSRNAEPTEVLLYGFTPETQWAAIAFFENASGGMICEDYDRNPPEERRRYQGGLGLSGSTRARRTLTRREAQLAFQYHGGDCWIKVTFDSKEAAERAVAASPHLMQGYWVTATLWKGQPPEKDEPISMQDEDRQSGSLTGPRLSRDAASHLRRPSGIPQNPALPTTPGRSAQFDMVPEESPLSTTTASSATATAPENDVRQRNTGLVRTQTDATMKLFKDQRRTLVRPATDALLPTPTWSERFWAWLTNSGLVPGEVIGSTVPRLETGEFDWNAASYYWQFMKWLDDTLGTDMCGMKSD